MTAGIDIRTRGAAGRITLCRPDALNALSHDMALAIAAALKAWETDDAVALVLIDAEGDKAFCAGGDIQDLYETGRAGDFAYGRRFWADEYRMNLALHDYPKPVVSLMQGFTMGGGVGVGCHGSHRIVCESARIAMPEVGIGLVPDVGGSRILAHAPGRLGEFLGLTATRMEPGDAILAGFADLFVPRDRWADLVARLETGLVSATADCAAPPPEAPLESARDWIDQIFAAADPGEIECALTNVAGDAAAAARKALARNSPLAMACGLTMIRGLRASGANMAAALAQEYRYTYRAMEHGDFIEGIRAAIIDRDRSPRWRHAGPGSVSAAQVDAMLATLGADELTFGEETTS